MRAYYQPDDVDVEVVAIAHELAKANLNLYFVGISFTDGRSLRDDDPVWDEERLESRWWKADRDRGDLGALKSLEDIPTDEGLKIRSNLYETDFGSSDWEVKLLTSV